VLRCLNAGESHGPRRTAIHEGCPAGVAIGIDAIDRDMRRRMLDATVFLEKAEVDSVGDSRRSCEGHLEEIKGR